MLLRNIAGLRTKYMQVFVKTMKQILFRTASLVNASIGQAQLTNQRVETLLPKATTLPSTSY